MASPKNQVALLLERGIVSHYKFLNRNATPAKASQTSNRGIGYL